MHAKGIIALATIERLLQSEGKKIFSYLTR
jgi:hypothetical protein